MDGLSVIGKMLSNSIPKVKEKALNTFNNLSMNVKNQEEIKVSVLKGTITEAKLNNRMKYGQLGSNKDLSI